jgi:hypothetical protein
MKLVLDWTKKKTFSLNATRAGSILAVNADFNQDFNLSMTYSSPDPRTNVMEHKSLSFIREDKKDGTIDVELTTKSEISSIVHKIQMTHPEFMVIRRLIDVDQFQPVWSSLHCGLACSQWKKADGRRYGGRELPIPVRMKEEVQTCLKLFLIN